jgi:ABC-type multidrug transport system fused ATPase/permease subunit
MELNDFIASGIIESYLLGTATREEITLMQEMLQKHPSVKTELEEVEESLLKLAELNETKINEGLKEKIFAAIQFQQPTSIHDPSIKENPVNVISMQKGPGKMYLQYGIAASVGLLIISTVMNIMLFNQTTRMNNELSQLGNQNTKMQSEMSSQKKYMEDMTAQFAIITDPENASIPLKGLDVSPQSLATVYWNKVSKDVYLYVNNLPAAPADKQYQLWAIIDGKPVDAGVFDTGMNSQLQKMNLASAPQAFAVTLEKKGGSPVPTLEAMYLLGEV